MRVSITNIPTQGRGPGMRENLSYIHEDFLTQSQGEVAGMFLELLAILLPSGLMSVASFIGISHGKMPGF